MNEAERVLWERSRSLANFYLHAISMQIDRLREPALSREEFPLRPIAEFEFLCVALVRLRRAAELATAIPAIRSHMESAIAAFETAVPNLVTYRNVAEHFDDYVLGVGRDKSRPASEFRSGLQVSSWSEVEFRWLDSELNYDACQLAACELFEAIRQAKP